MLLMIVNTMGTLYLNLGDHLKSQDDKMKGNLSNDIRHAWKTHAIEQASNINSFPVNVTAVSG